MVIGNGLIAKVFTCYCDNNDVIIFASGVSNSLETDQTSFNREFELLKKTIDAYPSSKLVYFSTISIEDPAVNESPYVLHKLRLENFIKYNLSYYLICRVSNVVGFSNNKHTIMNFLVNAIKKDIKIDIWSQAERNLIDKDDLKYIVGKLLEDGFGNNIITIATGESVLVTSILSQIELYFQKKAIVNLIPKGNRLNLDISTIASQLKEIEFTKGKGEAYINNLLKKYY